MASALEVDVWTFKYELELTVVNVILIRSEDLAEIAFSCSQTKRTMMNFPFFPPPLKYKALVSNPSSLN